ncbi:hypothetical protein [Pontiella sulfatireligans]|uniref:Uncharacterized protein n=1 Tax=Pontiella sulfatireligans TaxID=2750658 RepID=A0A6C2UF48_9BACT|nr:hypothetical protein [Pontiella sulfatireligans]VGO18157.1 hypothetical protein SCARR_00208 [Pontiella sulfatireligans]
MTGKNIVKVALGTVELDDVGAQIQIDSGYRHLANLTSLCEFKLDDYQLDGVCKRICSFKSDTVLNNTSLPLSTADHESEGGRKPGMTGVLSYIVQPDDVGKELSLEISVYDSTPEGKRTLLIESISYHVAVPHNEALGLVLWFRLNIVAALSACSRIRVDLCACVVISVSGDWH